MHTAFLLNQIEKSDAQDKSMIKAVVNKCEVQEIKELTKYENMKTKLDEESDHISLRQLFSAEAEAVRLEPNEQMAQAANETL